MTVTGPRQLLESAAAKIINAQRAVAFTGAGISVESGIPPFRGPDGLWEKYDPIFLDINHFQLHPKESWLLIKEIFYDFFGRAKPNKAHLMLAEMENLDLIKAVITQNIDNLHQEAGSRNVYEFHGTSKNLLCSKCGLKHNVADVNLDELPPVCRECGGILRPDFVFFGEAIPEPANRLSFAEAQTADLFLVIGTTGEIMPASMIPFQAKQHGAFIIEVNTEPSRYTNDITDIFLQGRATDIMGMLGGEIYKYKNGSNI
ncbi:NAD-dependent deacylase [bacterium]|nr:NAD-dependent deacylase [bacterium]